MRLKQLLLCGMMWMCCVPLGAQTSKEEMFSTIEKTGGVYWAYPLDFAPQTRAPKGYKPFYVSHYGRHGSRYLIGDRLGRRYPAAFAEGVGRSGRPWR